MPVLIVLIILDLSCELPSSRHFFLSIASNFRAVPLFSPNFLHCGRIKQAVLVVEPVKDSALLQRALNAFRVLDSLDWVSPVILDRR